MKSYKSGFYVIAVILSFLAVVAILYSYYEETGNEADVSAPLRQDYDNLLGTFSVEYPGRGNLDYPGNVSADYAKSYAMFLSAELLRAQSEPIFQLSPVARNAGYWLLNNADTDQDLVIGWGLPVAWDAYQDGTVNPADTIYTITTAIAINSLLDWLEVDPNAPSDRIIATVDAAFQPFLDPGMITPNGLIPYSLSGYDQNFDTYNPAAYMAGQMQRFSTIVADAETRKQLQSVADRVMISLLESKLYDQNGGWYWFYSADQSTPNDAAHALYIVDGIYQYIKHNGSIANQFEWEYIARHIDLFYSSDDQVWKRFPQVWSDSYNDPPRLYELGMLMHFMGMTGRHEEGLSLYQYSLTYRLPDGNFAKIPAGEYEYDENEQLVVNEYMSYLLYGWSSLLFAPADSISPVTGNIDVSQSSTFPNTDLESPLIVPFTYFDVADYEIDLEFNINLLEGNLIINNKRVALPSRALPLKIIEWDPLHLIVFTRELWSSQVHIWVLDIRTANFQQLPLPGDLNLSMFRQAVLYNDHIVFILFDPIEKTNYLYRLLPASQDELPIEFDQNFKEEFYIDVLYGYRQQPHILTTEFQGRLYFCSDSVTYEYKFSPSMGEPASIISFGLPNHYRVLEVAADEVGIFALYQDIDYSVNRPLTEQNKPFVLYDIANQKLTNLVSHGFIPYNLHVVDGMPVTSFVEKSSDLLNVFLLDMRNMPSSGMMSAGVNNFEGEVIWTQSYYLNAIIDILGGNADFRTNSPFNSIKPQLKHRLDFEMALIDRMVLEGPGLLSKTFTVDRTPVLHAVQTGKFLLLMKRYLALPNAIELESYEIFQKQVIGLDGHIEELTQAEPDDLWLPEGRYYLKWPKGSAFWADGVGIPYNHQNMWVAGILFENENAKNLPDETQQAFRDIGSQVLDYEGFRNFIPKHSNWYSDSPEYFEWNYWWGQAKAGWTETDKVSLNTPSWVGDGDNIAIPVYRTFDATSILITGEYDANILPTGIVEYFREGVERDGLELFLIPYLERYGKTPDVGPELASKYLRFANQPDLRNAVWSYQYLNKYNDFPALPTKSRIQVVTSAGIFLLDALFVFLCALFLTTILKIDRIIPWLLSLYLFSYAMIVLTVEVGGTLLYLNSKVFFLVFHSLLLIILTSIWLYRSSPCLFAPLNRLCLKRTSFLRSVREHWDVWIFVFICVVGFLFLGYSNLVLPQKIDDVITAYLARVGYWLQNGNLSPWPADIYQMSQIIYPLNAQAQVYWSVLFLQTDQLAGFSQWITLPVILLNIYGLCRLLQLSRKWAIIAALLSFSLPNIYLQSLGAMTDLVSAALFISAIYLFFMGLPVAHTGVLVLSGLAISLSIGTKQTIIFALPGLIIVLLFILVTRKRFVIKSLMQWAGASIVTFLLAGAYVYVFNYFRWGSPLGPPATYQGFTQRDAALPVLTLLTRFFENMRRLLEVIFKIDLYSWNYDGNAWPGPALLVLVFFALLYIGYLAQIRKINLIAYSLFVIAIFNSLILLLVRDFTGSLSRYLITPIVLIIPLSAAGMKIIAQRFDSQYSSDS